MSNAIVAPMESTLWDYFENCGDFELKDINLFAQQ